MIQANQIKPEMSVVCSKDGAIGVVDHMEGADTIKLKKDGKGKHHFIPLAWVKSLDSKVHIDRPGEQAMKEWTDSAPAKGANGKGADKSNGKTVASAKSDGNGNGKSYGKSDGKSDGNGKVVASATADDDEEVDGDVDGDSSDADITAPDGERRKARGGAPGHASAMKASSPGKPLSKR